MDNPYIVARVKQVIIKGEASQGMNRTTVTFLFTLSQDLSSYELMTTTTEVVLPTSTPVQETFEAAWNKTLELMQGIITHPDIEPNWDPIDPCVNSF